MSWVRLDDNFPDHPKVNGLSHGAFRCLITLWCDSAKYLTDGLVDESALARRFRARSAAVWLRELHAAGLLERRESGYVVHDYLDYNPSKVQVLARREVDRVRQKSHRDRKSRHGVSHSAPTRPLLNRDSKTSRRDQPSEVAYTCEDCEQPAGVGWPAFQRHLDECPARKPQMGEA